MLSVVDVELTAAEGVGESTQLRLRLEQRDVTAGVGEPDRRRDAGEATAHDDAAAHRPNPARDLTATPVFAQGDSERRRSRIDEGSSEM